MRYREDEFDLTAFQNETIRKRMQIYRQKYQKAADLIVFIVVLTLLAGGFFLLNAINAAADKWRIQQYYENAFEQAVKPPANI